MQTCIKEVQIKNKRFTVKILSHNADKESLFKYIKSAKSKKERLFALKEVFEKSKETELLTLRYL